MSIALEFFLSFHPRRTQDRTLSLPYFVLDSLISSYFASTAYRYSKDRIAPYVFLLHLSRRSLRSSMHVTNRLLVPPTLILSHIGIQTDWRLVTFHLHGSKIGYPEDYMLNFSFPMLFYSTRSTTNEELPPLRQGHSRFRPLSLIRRSGRHVSVRLNPRYSRSSCVCVLVPNIAAHFLFLLV